MKHTPGPWTAIKPTQTNGRAEVYAGNVLVAQAFNWMLDSTGEDHCRADARLIAAAPELLEALKRLRNLAAATMGSGVTYTGDHPIEVARRAIAKAEGA